MPKSSYSVCSDSDRGMDQRESERVHLSRAVGRPAVCTLLSHMLGRAGHRVVTYHGNTYKGTRSQSLQPGPERAAPGQT